MLGDPHPLDFARDGAELFPAALAEPQCAAIEDVLAGYPADLPGLRIADAPALAGLLAADGPIGRVAATALGAGARPVRAILFDKGAARNWGLGWHQDRTIVVAERAAVDGFGPWTIKAGLVQVEPPFAIIERMVTLRVHLDAVDAENAPLRILTGSHRLGRLEEAAIEQLVETAQERACLAARGDIWLYATPIVHASSPASRPRRRRVMQVDYAAEALAEPLRWRGV